jgi:hypothetical protein
MSAQPVYHPALRPYSPPATFTDSKYLAGGDGREGAAVTVRGIILPAARVVLPVHSVTEASGRGDVRRGSHAKCACRCVERFGATQRYDSAMGGGERGGSSRAAVQMVLISYPTCALTLWGGRGSIEGPC